MLFSMWNSYLDEVSVGIIFLAGYTLKFGIVFCFLSITEKVASPSIGNPMISVKKGNNGYPASNGYDPSGQIILLKFPSFVEITSLLNLGRTNFTISSFSV